MNGFSICLMFKHILNYFLLGEGAEYGNPLGEDLLMQSLLRGGVAMQLINQSTQYVPGI